MSGTGGLSRVAALDASAVLQTLAGAGVLERGAAVVLGVDAIQERVGDRWSRRREDVWRYVERKCEEHLSPHDIRHRISDTDYLIALTREEGIAAQAIALKIMEEVLHFFLGEAQRVDIRIRRVAGVEGNTLTCAPLDLAELAANRDVGRGASTAARRDPDNAQRGSSVSFVTASGEPLRIDFSVERLLNLRHQVTAALRINPSVASARTGARLSPRRLRQLSHDEIAAIDRATLGFGASLLPQDVRREPAVMAPVSFHTIGGRRGRSALLAPGGAEPHLVKRGLLLELTDVHPGTPPSRLAEVMALAAQLCRAVFPQIPLARDASAPLGEARVQGLSLDAAVCPLEDDMLSKVLLAMGRQMSRRASVVIVHGLPHVKWVERAKAAGFTHASVRARIDARRADSGTVHGAP